MIKINKVIMTGFIANELDIKFASSGKTYAKFNLGVKDDFDKDKIHFVKCTAFNKTAELLGEYCKKGSKIAIEAKFSQDSYEKDGVKVSSYSILIDRIEFLSTNKHSDKKEEDKSYDSLEDFEKDFNEKTKEEIDDEFPF